MSLSSYKDGSTYKLVNAPDSAGTGVLHLSYGCPAGTCFDAFASLHRVGAEAEVVIDPSIGVPAYCNACIAGTYILAESSYRNDPDQPFGCEIDFSFSHNVSSPFGTLPCQHTLKIFCSNTDDSTATVRLTTGGGLGGTTWLGTFSVGELAVGQSINIPFFVTVGCTDDPLPPAVVSFT